MKYLEVQTLLETFVQNNVTGVQVTFENMAFASDVYTEWVRSTIQFGDSLLRALSSNCYRVAGIHIFEIYVRPATGSARIHELADTLTSLFKGAKIAPVIVETSPTVYYLAPTLSKFFAERTGWVSAQLTCPFYYDLEG